MLLFDYSVIPPALSSLKLALRNPPRGPGTQRLRNKHPETNITNMFIGHITIWSKFGSFIDRDESLNACLACLLQGCIGLPCDSGIVRPLFVRIPCVGELQHLESQLTCSFRRHIWLLSNDRHINMKSLINVRCLESHAGYLPRWPCETFLSMSGSSLACQNSKFTQCWIITSCGYVELLQVELLKNLAGILKRRVEEMAQGRRFIATQVEDRLPICFHFLRQEFRLNSDWMKLISHVGWMRKRSDMSLITAIFLITYNCFCTLFRNSMIEGAAISDKKVRVGIKEATDTKSKSLNQLCMRNQQGKMQTYSTSITNPSLHSCSNV